MAEVELLRDWEDGAVEAIVERIPGDGTQLRVELALGDGTPVSARVTRDELDELELTTGDILWVR